MTRSLAAAAFALLALNAVHMLNLQAAPRLAAEYGLISRPKPAAVYSPFDSKLASRARILRTSLQEPPKDAPLPNIPPPPLATEPPAPPVAPNIAPPSDALPTPKPAAAPDAPPVRPPSELPQPAMDPASSEEVVPFPTAPPQPRMRQPAPPRSRQSAFEMDAELPSPTRPRSAAKLVTPSPSTPDVASGPTQLLTLPEGLRYVGQGVFEHRSEAGSIQFRPVANDPGTNGRVVQLPDGVTYQGPWPPPVPETLPQINQPRDSFFDPLKGTPVIQELSRQLVEFQKFPKKTPEQAYESEMLRQAVLKQLGQEFDARQNRYDEELNQLEAKVQKLKDLARRRQEARDQIIDRRLDQLLRDAEGLGW
ncbi:hypothetical protein [Paludisphaera rhizosphaerae]|uniref:hypothetical protein n=1 Tax=Paludisphaera rhizosphaerae TaxID=2711216 RepID=UPI0013EBBF11|nr:hypothetical protein [Paludisphaera rhizosphaerae]